MATKLESKVVRESSVYADEREVIISLNEDQTISLKLKGMKSGTVSVGIRELWDMLNEDVVEKPKTIVPIKHDGKDQLISLKRLRTLNAVTKSDLAVTLKLEEIITDLLKGKNLQ